MFLIPKSGGDYRSIGLGEEVWKAVAVILDRSFTASITYHNSLNGFRETCRMVTATLKFKMIQKVVALKEEVLHVIFLDLYKAYDALYRSRYLEILEEYGVGPRALHLFRSYLERLKMVARSGGYYQ